MIERFLQKGIASMPLSLIGQSHPLGPPAAQRETLARTTDPTLFDARLTETGLAPLSALGIDVLQINLGKLCNQTCKHCHVDAGPDRRESMSRETMEHCLRVLETTDVRTVDLTGGAPELNPNFRWLVDRARELGRKVIDRCNLTILLVPSQKDLAEFLASRDVEIVASLPYYLARSTDAQRGDGVFDASIEALKRLNALGYGVEGSPLTLHLAFNPVGAFLPPRQDAIEADFRRELLKRHGVVFHRLYALANMPISRFLEFLVRTDQHESYMRRLIAAYNPRAAENVMCRTMISVGWDGRLYDCDFNQMLDMPLSSSLPRHISEFDARLLADRLIMTGPHCFGCTAGAGSSCAGAARGD